MIAIFRVLHLLISLYYWVLIGSAVMSWLIAFNVLNTYNRFVASIAEMLYRLTDPVLRPIRRVIPSLGGIDISPVIAMLILYFIDQLLYEYVG